MPVVRLRKPNAIVMDVTGTCVTRAFMVYSPESKDFIRNNIRDYVNECWNKKDMRLSVSFIKNEQDNRCCVEGEPPIADIRQSLQDQMSALIANILWRVDNEKTRKSPALGLFHLYMSDWGYRKGLLRTPVYEEAPSMMVKWKTVDNIKIYIALGSANLLRSVFSQTSSGDLLPYIDGHMNLMHGSLKNFSKLPELLNEPASRILFITRLPHDARLASRAAIKSIIVVRSDFDPNAIQLILERDVKRARRKSRAVSKQATAQNDTQRVTRTPSTSSTASTLLSPIDPSQVSPPSSPPSPATVPSPELAATVAAQTVSDSEELSTASKLTTRDIREFIVVQRLDEIQWEIPTHKTVNSKLNINK